MAAVHLLVELAPGQPDLLGVGHDDEVAGVEVRDVARTVFAREHHRDARGESPEHLVRRIHDVPVMPDILDGNHGRTRGHQNPSKIFQSWTREAEGGASGTEIAPSKGRVRIRKQVGGVKCRVRLPNTVSGVIALDGTALAKQIRQQARAEALGLFSAPSLVVLLLGHDPASETYVASKTRAAAEAGIRATRPAGLRLPARGPARGGPGAMGSRRRRRPRPDAARAGPRPRAGDRLARPGEGRRQPAPREHRPPPPGPPRFVPCTPAGIIALLDFFEIQLAAGGPWCWGEAPSWADLSRRS